MSSKDKPTILSIKTISGEVFAGDFIETCKEHGRDVHVLNVDGLVRYVPVSQCEWWAKGEESALEVRRRIREEMKQEATALLEERLQQQQVQTDEQYDQEVHEEEALSDQELQALRDRVSDHDNYDVQESLRRVATHQRSLSERSVPDTRIIQPGEEEEEFRRQQQSDEQARRPSKRSIARLPDDTPEV